MILSKSQNRVARLRVQGYQIKEVADKLFLSTNTVHKHQRDYYQIAQVRNEVEFLIWYYDKQLGVNLLQILNNAIPDPDRK